MASSAKHVVLFLTILLGILSISATARPCKALFISTYSFSFKPQNPNPNPNPSGSLTVFTTQFTQFNNPNTEIEIFLDRRLRFHDDELQIQRQHHHQHHQRQRPVNPFGFSSSLRDRTKDILSVVVALLFGVGCGALAAATMYLVWTLFASRYDYLHCNEFDDLDVDEEADVSPKKMGYVKIPAADK